MGNIIIFLAVSLFRGYNTKIQSYIRKNTGFQASYSKSNWTNVGPEGGYFLNVAADPQDSNLAILQGVNLWITRDGNTWQMLREDGFYAYITFTGYHRLLLGIHDTLYYSSDGGMTFSPIRTTGYIRTMSRIPSDTVYLVQDSVGVSYLYLTTDGGINWDRVSPLSYVNYKYITYAPSDPNIIYMAASLNYSSDSVYIIRSNDGGITWHILSLIGEGSDVTDIEVNPQDPREAFAACGFDGGFGLIYTTDSFQTINFLPQMVISYDVEFISPDSILVANIIPNGIMLGIKDSSGNWSFDPVDTLTTCTGIARSGNVFYVSATTGALKSIDGGMSFYTNESGLHGTITYSGGSISKMIGRTVYMPSIQGNALYITHNGGVTWQKVYIPDVAIIFDVEANPGDENIVYIACGAGKMDTSGNFILHNILRSSDGGVTFTPVDSFTGNPDSLSWKESLHAFSDSSNVLLAMVMVYSDSGPDTMKIVRSTDQGASFNDTIGIFTYFYEDFAGDNPVFIEADSAIFVSYDYGLTFNILDSVPNTIESMTYYDKDSTLFYNTYEFSDSAYALRITNLQKESFYVPGIYTLYAAENGGLYALATNYPDFTFYRGTFESPFNSSETLSLPSGAIRASSNEVLLFSYGMGVFRSVDAVSSIKDEKGITKSSNFKDILFVESNILHIPSSISANEARIFTLDGRLIKTIEIQRRKHISLKNLKAGIYMIKLIGRDNRILRIVKIK